MRQWIHAYIIYTLTRILCLFLSLYLLAIIPRVSEGLMFILLFLTYWIFSTIGDVLLVRFLSPPVYIYWMCQLFPNKLHTEGEQIAHAA